MNAEIRKGGIAMPRYIAVAQRSDLPEGAVRTVEVDGRPVALFHVGGALYAIDDTCPHMGGSLSEGEVEGDEVTCPWHAARFSLRTGEALSPPADEAVACYKVRAEGDAIEIEVAD